MTIAHVVWAAVISPSAFSQESCPQLLVILNDRYFKRNSFPEPCASWHVVHSR